MDSKRMKKISDAVERHRETILEAERYLWQHPETGFKEVETTKYLYDIFTRLGYYITLADGIPGFYTVIDTGRPGPEIMILAELDSVICPTHKSANPETGAVHACGHHAQCATLIGVAAALREPGMLDGMSGRIRLCAVPAEELLEIEYRSSLKAAGKIKYLGGKCEFLSRGYFDGVDLAFMVHAGTHFGVNRGMIGLLSKQITYKGVASHAGGAPQNGRNALYAATCGLNAINAVRETFTESDLARVHPIITHGGDMVNAIPASVRLECQVRGRTYDAIKKNNIKINSALAGAALSLRNNVEIVDIPGYSPLENDSGMIDVFREAASFAIPDEEFRISSRIATGSTDLGDLSRIMPVVHPSSGGDRGTKHGSDYEVVDPVTACVTNAKWELAALNIFLEGGGKRAKKIVDAYEPEFSSKEEFLSFLSSFACSGDRIQYNDDGTATVKLQ